MTVTAHWAMGEPTVGTRRLFPLNYLLIGYRKTIIYTDKRKKTNTRRIAQTRSEM